ncbi:hypothetical protein SAMN05421841_0283 [Chryseobacterium wanjuense]|uniref:Uncharacterized protein n=2 Tax=Chryseobacterium wanjuense TaxID=356305 RepID=A0A1I0MY53_9FLAO|nr:hypothetical protein SAMN05421841_0283 [Chryseobacterium wanjuense]
MLNSLKNNDMEKEICTISITTNWLGDEYTFYEDDRIKRVYDNNSLSSDVTEWLEPNQISKQNKDKLVKNCPEEFKERIMLILDYP